MSVLACKLWYVSRGWHPSRLVGVHVGGGCWSMVLWAGAMPSVACVMPGKGVALRLSVRKVKPPLRGLEQSSLLATCFCSVFSLPPAEPTQDVEAALYIKTLKVMDEMLKALVCEDQKPNLLVLQNILEQLLVSHSWGNSSVCCQTSGSGYMRQTGTIIAKAITILNLILTGLDRQSTSPAAMQVAEELLPFFDDVRPDGLRETDQATDV
ncbi:hypothetical protein UY3_14421 [Chelonia mydas]|uniref:Uncharacterized protein n=1 Tax=Chelonia mydas TaxID=8469 RepID=M7B8H2_CHEMY|nr:hypothetical protein UY3_14421 [Chelonia mydas]